MELGWWWREGVVTRFRGINRLDMNHCDLNHTNIYLHRPSVIQLHISLCILKAMV